MGMKFRIQTVRQKVTLPIQIEVLLRFFEKLF